MEQTNNDFEIGTVFTNNDVITISDISATGLAKQSEKFVKKPLKPKKVVKPKSNIRSLQDLKKNSSNQIKNHEAEKLHDEDYVPLSSQCSGTESDVECTEKTQKLRKKGQ